ncbi:MAG TPA: hypothetical protein VN736_00075 [Candidatus Limnocylindrales bacterium]|nr:hypothetical protein [Candidatus Limnocylindrales bacterium]
MAPGNDVEGGAEFVDPRKPAGSLVLRVLNGSIWFSVNDRSGRWFQDNEGFFEFDFQVGP